MKLYCSSDEAESADTMVPGVEYKCFRCGKYVTGCAEKGAGKNCAETSAETLRDHFAHQVLPLALQRVWNFLDEGDVKVEVAAKTAEIAYAIVDAMLAERTRRKS